MRRVTRGRISEFVQQVLGALVCVSPRSSADESAGEAVGRCDRGARTSCREKQARLISLKPFSGPSVDGIPLRLDKDGAQLAASARSLPAARGRAPEDDPAAQDPIPETPAGASRSTGSLPVCPLEAVTRVDLEFDKDAPASCGVANSRSTRPSRSRPLCGIGTPPKAAPRGSS
jgi:hypothetical protein